jgi:hypothetical protein
MESGGGRQAPKGWYYFLFSSSQPLELRCCVMLAPPREICGLAGGVQGNAPGPGPGPLWMDGPIEVFDWMDELNRRLLEASWMWMVGTGGFKARLGGSEIQDLPASWHCASRARGTNKERRKAPGWRSKAGRHRWLGCQHRRARSCARVRACGQARSRVQDGSHA